MPRKIVPMVSSDPYHITDRCINREWFLLPLGSVWSIMEDYLYLINLMFGLKIHCFVLMGNHFHLLATAPEGNLSEALQYFLRETSKWMTRLSGRINQTYGARNHKTHLGSYHSFVNTYKYVYRNPVRAGVCHLVEEYPFSTLHSLCGFRKLVVPLVEDTILFNPEFDDSALNWLNTKASADHEEEIRLALRRPTFELKTSRKTGKKSRLEFDLA